VVDRAALLFDEVLMSRITRGAWSPEEHEHLAHL